MRAVLPLGALIVGAGCFAEEPQLSQDLRHCKAIASTDERLACFDALAPPVSASEKPAKDGPSDQVKKAGEDSDAKAGVLTWIRIRQKGDFTNFGSQDLVDKPAQLNLHRTDGKDGSVVKMAAIATPDIAFGTLGWQPFGAGAWNRDTTGAKPKDLREVSIGIVGSLWDAYPAKWTLLPTLRAIHRQDIYGTTDANQISLHVNLVVLKWVDSVPTDGADPYKLVPHFGYLAERRVGGGQDAGGWGSAYVGFDASIPIPQISPRLAATLTYQHFSDQKVPAGQAKREANYTNAAINYDFTDPLDPSIKFRPSLSLTHERGTDVLSGGDKANKTSLGLGIKFN